MTHPRPVTVGLLLALGLAGCSHPVRPLTGFRPAPNPVEVDAAEYDRVFEASVDVLRDAGFRVNRRDYRFGDVATYPDTSPTVFEPWKADNTTPALIAQSTLNNTRRIVRVSLDPVTGEEQAAMDDVAAALDAAAPPADTQAEEGKIETETPEAYRLRVQVDLENLQQPTRRLTMAQHGYAASSLTTVPTEWRERGIESAYWLPVGRDEMLEQRLIRAIVERSLTLPDESAPAASVE